MLQSCFKTLSRPVSFLSSKGEKRGKGLTPLHLNIEDNSPLARDKNGEISLLLVVQAAPRKTRQNGCLLPTCSNILWLDEPNVLFYLRRFPFPLAADNFYLVGLFFRTKVSTNPFNY